jgi:NTP pyrophosphatase (non-canonical NTP hydrolase)
MDVSEIQNQLRQFTIERDWEQYHSPKNLSIALAVEAAELMEIFQWVSAEESMAIANNPTKHAELKAELADVLIYALRLADVASIDPEEAINDLKLLVSSKLDSSSYVAYRGAQINLPGKAAEKPSTHAVTMHRKERFQE